MIDLQRLPARLLMATCVAALAAGEGEPYRYRVDLTAVADDAFTVTLQPPALPAGEAVFQFAATAPGTYETHDWGRLVRRFTVKDAAGQDVGVRKDGHNRFVIADGARARSIAYVIDDSLDADLKENRPLPMAATNIEPDNIFINTFGVYGYFPATRDHDFLTTYRLPAGWIAASALPQRIVGNEITYTAKGYDRLADAPVLVGALDVGSVPVARATVLVAVQTHNGRTALQAARVVQVLTPVLEATARYLDGLPIDRYAFLVHARNAPLGVFGALEHMRSSLYVLPANYTAERFRDIAAHEFFHIVTPLNLRSTVIDRYDFAQPTPSKHLWLYEGVTEYCSHHLQAKAGLTAPERWCALIGEKAAGAARYDASVAMTELSLGCYGRHARLYADVYQRGFLLAMALDLELLRLTNGRMALRDLVLRLIRRYGQDKPFTEDELFDRIAVDSHAGIRQFFARHIEAAEPPPYAELLATAGIAWERGRARLLAQPTAEQQRLRLRWLTYSAEGGGR